jgi:hypothetical protein
LVVSNFAGGAAAGAGAGAAGGDWPKADWAIKATLAASSNDPGNIAFILMTRLLFFGIGGDSE